MFKSPEMFLVAVVGITIIASLSGSGKIFKKGLLAGMVGLLIGAMSADSIHGRPRLDFGFYELYDSFPLIPPLVGLFSFPSLFALVGTQQIAPPGTENIGRWGNVMKGVWGTFKNPFILVWSSFVGLVVGIIPGPGIDTAAFLAYGQAKAWCKNPELFGKGHPAGVIAPEAANNGVTGGALVPTLTLGIPGAATTAIMLATLILHGILPGPNVMRDFPGPVSAVLLACFFGSFLCFFIGMFFNRVAAKVTTIPTEYLLPATLLTTIVSAYAFRYFMFDIYLMLLFGLIGFVMKKNGYPTMPLVLGLVMGPMAEPNFLRALVISLGNYSTFVSSPICIVLLAIIGGTVVSMFLQPVLRQKMPKKT
jgi:putative tricarboxylic transport membrane protein